MSALAVAAAMRRRLLGGGGVMPVKIEFGTSNADFAEDGGRPSKEFAVREVIKKIQRPRPRHGQDSNGNGWHSVGDHQQRKPDDHGR